ncbi:MAG: glycogen synthase [Bacillus sp. (in: firmicutes)]
MAKRATTKQAEATVTEAATINAELISTPTDGREVKVKGKKKAQAKKKAVKKTNAKKQDRKGKSGAKKNKKAEAKKAITETKPELVVSELIEKSVETEGIKPDSSMLMADEVQTKQEPAHKIKVLIAASESMPFITTGGLGEVTGSLPKAIMKENPEQFDVRVILPLYESISQSDREQMEFLGHFEVGLAWRRQYCGVFRTVRNGVTYYFIDNEYYFKRFNPYGYMDDGERFAFFSKAVLDSQHLLGFHPDIIHCHDWQTALIPVYMHHVYHHIHAKTVFTIHNIEYQGQMGFEIIGDLLGLPAETKSSLEYKGCVNLMKAAIECAHQVNTVSPTYAQELKDDYYAKGLAAIIHRNDWKIRGIINGIDTESYNPATDGSLFVNYDVDSLDKKKQNKRELQQLVNLPVNEEVPVIAIVSRLVSHKGMDLVAGMMERLLNENVQVVVLGIGERKYEDYFNWLQWHYQGKVTSMQCFNHDLARKVYAGADFLLMPSKSEPCGLAQMIACRYGTVPIVRSTGGLQDTVQDCSAGEGNGFGFEGYTADGLLDAVHRGLHVYWNREGWNELVKWIMKIDFSWEHSSKEYESLYKELCPELKATLI